MEWGSFSYEHEQENALVSQHQQRLMVTFPHGGLFTAAETSSDLSHLYPSSYLGDAGSPCWNPWSHLLPNSPAFDFSNQNVNFQWIGTDEFDQSYPVSFHSSYTINSGESCPYDVPSRFESFWTPAESALQPLAPTPTQAILYEPGLNSWDDLGGPEDWDNAPVSRTCEKAMTTAHSDSILEESVTASQLVSFNVPARSNNGLDCLMAPMRWNSVPAALIHDEAYTCYEFVPLERREHIPTTRRPRKTPLGNEHRNTPGPGSYAKLLENAFSSRSDNGYRMNLCQIYTWFQENDQAVTSRRGWKNSVRYNLSMNEVWHYLSPVVGFGRDADDLIQAFENVWTSDNKRVWKLANDAIKNGVGVTVRYKRGKKPGKINS
ncbi:hypothetical protein B0J13DRAFT_292022 [Dactylonectria estremocensis]|uniref:Fork-head domain-containing protein n=1 Tax=Dactylonectria estremocensis TaxID=1079267 RepID=A0A9P9I8M2_9HYPO|nr:hypothetical protein B0J13DRAFT_292022 [Dactylonectria estremocensis]